jgi:membrane fusion protein (multidrug efflux system)
MASERFNLNLSPKSSKLVYWLVASLGLILASGLGYWLLNKGASSASLDSTSANKAAAAGSGAPAPGAGGRGGVGVEVAKVEKMLLRDDAQSVGSLRSRQNVMLRPEVAGRVAYLGFNDGARVKRDQVLVQLDDSLQRAEMKQAQAQVALAETRYKRNQELLAQKFVAQSALDDSDSNLKVAQAQLDLSCARLVRMRITAPFDGTVGIRNINIGDYVKDGADLINLEDIGTLYVDFRLPERYQMRLRRGQEVELELDSFPGRQFKAKVDAIDPLIDANGRSISVRALMSNDFGQAKAPPAGMPGRPGAGAGNAPAIASSGGPNMAGRAPGAGGSSANPAVRMNAAAPSSQPDVMPLPIMSAEMKECLSRAASSTGGQTPGSPGGRSLASPAGALSVNATAGAGAPSGVGPLRPGMFARVTTVFAVKDNALVVPEEALVPQAGRQFLIKVVDRASLPAKLTETLPPEVKLVSQRVEVKVGMRRPGQVEITEGAVLGDTVVVAGQQRLQKDATPVRVIEVGRGGPPGGAGASGPAGGPASAASQTSSAGAAVAPPATAAPAGVGQSR